MEEEAKWRGGGGWATPSIASSNCARVWALPGCWTRAEHIHALPQLVLEEGAVSPHASSRRRPRRGQAGAETHLRRWIFLSLGVCIFLIIRAFVSFFLHIICCLLLFLSGCFLYGLWIPKPPSLGPSPGCGPPVCLPDPRIDVNRVPLWVPSA